MIDYENTQSDRHACLLWGRVCWPERKKKFPAMEDILQGRGDHR